MSILQNLHTHCEWCDGRNTAEEITRSAIEMGVDSLGFSAHSTLPFRKQVKTMPNHEIPQYRRYIRSLAETYKDQIEILCGLELDVNADVEDLDFDYLIGAVHAVEIGGEPALFLPKAENAKRELDTYFDGSFLKCARMYYELLCELPARANIDIIGHFDLVTKNAECTDLFDQDDPRYRRYALEAVDSLAGKIPLFEINTGSVARGYRETPFPAPFLLEALQKKGFGAVITSDCHYANQVLFGFADAKERLLAAGFREVYVYTKNGFRAIPLDTLRLPPEAY